MVQSHKITPNTSQTFAERAYANEQVKMDRADRIATEAVKRAQRQELQQPKSCKVYKLTEAELTGLDTILAEAAGYGGTGAFSSFAYADQNARNVPEPADVSRVTRGDIRLKSQELH